MAIKMAVIVAFVLFALVNAYDDLCSSAEMTSGPGIDNAQLVNSYLSVGGIVNATPLCGMQYRVPVNATVYQGMLAANQQHGNNFKFTSSVHPTWGHFIESINDVMSANGFYWFIFDNSTQMLTPVGVDWIDIVSESSYLWQYINSSEHVQNYTGPCDGSAVIPPTMPLTYKVAYLTVTSTNTTFKPVCKRPVLIQHSGTTAFTLLQTANDQLPIYVKAVLNVQTNTVTSFNGLANDERNTWTGYRAGSNEMIPYDLAMTAIPDGDHIIFRFEENTVLMATPGNGGAPSVCQLGTLFSAVMLLATVML